MAECSIEGCPRRREKRGWCNTHYRRWWTHGDPNMAPPPVTRTFADHPDGYRTMTIQGRRKTTTCLYDAEDEAVLRSRAWYANAKDYVVDGSGVFLARLLLGLAKNDPGIADHRNGQHADNRRSNLRVLTPRRNNENQAVMNGRGSSRYRNVHWVVAKGAWRATVKSEGRLHHIGYFPTDEAGAEAVAVWRAQNGIEPGY